MAARRAARVAEKAVPSLRRAVYGEPKGWACRQGNPQAQIIDGVPRNGRLFTSFIASGRENLERCTISRFQRRSWPKLLPSTCGNKCGSSIKMFSAAADLPPHEEIGMPSLSPTMTQGNIAKWRKAVGDEVAAGDVLCEIETDKATLEMESMEDGFVAKILHEDGAKDLPVGTPICIMVESKDDIAKFSDYSGGEAPSPPPAKAEEAEAAPPPPPPKEEQVPKPAAKSTESPPPPSSPAPGGRIFASPAAKKLAEDSKVDLSQVSGTGPDNRILKADIEDFLARKGPEPVAATKQPAAAPLESIDYTDLPNSQIRKITARRLLQSKQTVPHFYLSVDVKVDDLISLRSKLNAIQEKAGGKRLSVNDFVVKAAALALKKVPQCNSSWTDEFIREYSNVDISIAVQTERGLMVPIVKDADKKGLATISENVKELAEKARENKLKPSEFEGGTFTISNLGMYGIKSFSAIINPPQSCILAVGTTEKRVIPGAVAGEFDSATFMNVTLSCDHRVVDGAVGAQWVGHFKSYLEDPVTLLL